MLKKLAAAALVLALAVPAYAQTTKPLPATATPVTTPAVENKADVVEKKDVKADKKAEKKAAKADKKVAKKAGKKAPKAEMKAE